MTTFGRREAGIVTRSGNGRRAWNLFRLSKIDLFRPSAARESRTFQVNLDRGQAEDDVPKNKFSPSFLGGTHGPSLAKSPHGGHSPRGTP